MCMEDKRIGRETIAIQTQIDVVIPIGGGTVPVVGANADRVGLIITTFADLVFFYAGGNVGKNVIGRINNTTQNFIMTIETHGQLVMSDIYCFFNANTQLFVSELVLRKA